MSIDKKQLFLRIFIGPFVQPCFIWKFSDDYPSKVGLMEISRLNETKRPDVAILCKIFFDWEQICLLSEFQVRGNRVVVDGLKSARLLEGINF